MHIFEVWEKTGACLCKVERVQLAGGFKTKQKGPDVRQSTGDDCAHIVGSDRSPD